MVESMSSDSMLVTGATGMIGSALVERLRACGINVSAVGGETRGRADIDHFWKLGTSMGGALNGVKILLHLAGRVHVRGAGFSDEDQFFRDNAYSTLELAREAHARGVRRFVFVSSIGVLGANSEVPLVEEAVSYPHNAYTSSKNLAERLLKEFCETNEMEFVILRFPAVIGLGVKGNVSSLVRVVKWRFPLPFSYLNNQRQFITLRNLVEGVLLAATHENAANQTFHLANPERVSTLDLCHLIASELRVDFRSWPLPPILLRGVFTLFGRRSLADGLTADMLVDSSKISKFLGWRASQSIRSAIGEILPSGD